MKNIEDVKILVVGDIMLDIYTVGTVDRISPEAPVPVVNVVREYATLGGCGNVARNLKSLGVQVECLASIASDDEGTEVINLLEKEKIKSACFYGSLRTTTKQRIIESDRKVQMLRIDSEDTSKVDPSPFINSFKNIFNKEYDVIIISDYNKGVITYELMEFIKNNCNSKIIVDPKPVNARLYNKVFMITPNEKEWLLMSSYSSINFSNVEYILETRGKDGMKLIKQPEGTEQNIKGEEVQVFNVSGAGDTVIAVIGVCIAMGLPVLDSAKISNKCAGYVVTQPGTSIIPKSMFMKYLNSVTNLK